jgi:hypothetical protein
VSLQEAADFQLIPGDGFERRIAFKFSKGGGSMDKSKMVELVQRQLEAYNARDVLKFSECYHDSVIGIKLPDENTLFNGKAELHSIYKKIFDSTPNLNCQLLGRHIMEKSVIDIELVTGLPNYPDGLRATAVYFFADEKISRIWFAV